MVPVRIPLNNLNPSKFITQLELKDGNNLFDKKTGKVVLTDEPSGLCNKDFDI